MKKSHLKFVISIGISPLIPKLMPLSFRELDFSKGTGQIELSSKTDESGHYWITKVTATLLHDDVLLHEPCIVRVELRDCHYIIGTEDIPARPTVKEGVLTDFTLEYKSKSKPEAVLNVL